MQAEGLETRLDLLHSPVFYQADAQKKTAERAVANELENSVTINSLERKLADYEEMLSELDRSTSR